MWYGYLADAVVVLHVGYVAFVVVGQLAIVGGGVFRRQWVRNFWLRAAHLFAIAYVALEAVMQWRCPLTVWEEDLRILAGQPVEQVSFMGRLARSVLFFRCDEWVFDAMHIGFAALVLATFILLPPRLPFRRLPAVTDR